MSAEANLSAQIGGLFSFLAFIHFAVDWIIQSHAEAMVKHKHDGIRAKHCLIYTAPFVPILVWWGFDVVMVSGLSGVLFLSHYVEDTYKPVIFWMKHIRRHPAFMPGKDDSEAFLEAISADGGLGKILMIAVDQIIHLAFLFLIAVLAAT